MRRVSSYGGPSGVAGSERLRQKLSSTPGLHLLSSSSLGEAGFLAVAGDPHDERVFHRTYGAARNFYAISSNLKQVAKRESWLARKNPFGPVVKGTSVFDDPVDADEHCNGRAPVLLVAEVNGNHSSTPGSIDNGSRDVGVEGVHEISSNGSQVVEEVELEKSIGTSSSVDHVFELSDNQVCVSRLVGNRLGAGELQVEGPGSKVEQASIALAEVEGSISTSPLFAGKDTQTSRVGNCEADPGDNEAMLSNETSQEVETGAGLHDSENDRSKDMAAIDIQRYWRGCQERKQFKEVKVRIVFLQSLVRRNLELKQYHITMEAALVLQKYWRVAQSMKALKYLKSEQALQEDRKTYYAAIVVQTYWRSIRSRRLLIKLRKERALRTQQRNNNAAVVVQKRWRAQQGRGLVKVLKMEQVAREQGRIEDAAVVLQKHWRGRRGRGLVKLLKMEQAVKEKQRIDNAATIVLQKYWRAQQARCLTKHLRLEQVAREKQRLGDAAVVMQKYWRARRGRCMVKYLRMEQVVKEKQRVDNAAIVLQTYWRAQQARCLMKHLRLKQVAMEKQRNDYAAVVMQKHWRAWRGRCFVKQLRMEQVLREQQIILDATIVLQKCWRAQQGRRLMDLLKLELAAREQLRIDNAAIVLQKYWRAKQGRFVLRQMKSEQVAREHLRMDNAAIVLQKHWKSLQGRCLSKYLRMEGVAREHQKTNDAAIVVQKHWRAKQGRSYVKYLKLEHLAKEQQSAAIVIQKHCRAQQGRCLVNRLRMEQAVMELQRIDHAAIMIQKHYRAQQGRCLVNRLRTEQAVREKQRIDQAAIVLQKHWRARSGRFLVIHKKMELGVKELQRINHAAIMLQKLWRARQCRVLVEHMRMEQLVRQWKMADATIVLQKNWRGRQSRCLVRDLKKKQLEDNAVLVMQKCWRGKQSRLTVKHLNLEQAARERRRACAATALQKHWRARQSILLLKRLKMEAAVKDQQRVDDAATIVQNNWRGRHGRRLLKHLKSEHASRELERVDDAALVLQKYWRRFQSKQRVKSLYLEQVARERAALCIQARVRGNATRVKLKAALTIQKAWQLYWSSQVTVSAVSIQQAFPSNSDEERKILAIIVLQAYARGFVARRKLTQMPQSSNLSLQANHTSNKTFTKAGVAANTSPHMISSGLGLYARCLTQGEDSSESSPSSSIVHHVAAGVKSVDQTYSSHIKSRKHDPYAIEGVDAATPVGDVQLQKKGVQEDWNYVAVDQLEECLDTCLAVLRPLPSGSQHSLPELDVPEKSQHFNATDQNVENRKIVDSVSTSTCEVAQQGPRTRSDIGEPDNEPSNRIGSVSDESMMQSDLVMSQATAIGGTDDLKISSGPFQETGSQQMENPVQLRNLGRQTLKQNDQRLKQFAQVFLLQRHIALQQQRAQAAPPFPPPMSSGAEILSRMVNQPLEGDSRDQKDVAVDSTSVHTDAKLSQVDAGRPKDDHVVCDITDPNDEQTARRNSHPDQISGSKQVVNRPGPDVVLDMVLLLRRIEAEYGTSEGDFEGDSSTWCTPGCGDIEESIPLLDRNLGSMRRESSVAKFANAVSMKNISIPDMNAVLLVFIAMVVYTRTVCKGLFFGARQTHRRP